MTSQTTFMPQRPTRIPVDISVHITSVLDSGEAVLRDMTEYGALIEGLSLPKGMQFQIEYNGQTVFGFVVWSEYDRFGARFPFTLCEGPLHDRLQQARVEHGLHGAAGHHMFMGAKRPVANFGRRGLN
ncbi:MAG: PilZ domain-containing protein [Sphingobium sp.]